MVRRFSISLEEDLLSQFDLYLQSRQYNNRSEAIRDLIRKAFIEDEWEDDKEVVGVVSLVYDHHHSQVQERITEMQHSYHTYIVSSTHVHMDHDNCLEVIIVRGVAGEIRNLFQKLTALKGVKDSNLSASSTGRKLK